MTRAAAPAPPTPTPSHTPSSSPSPPSSGCGHQPDSPVQLRSPLLLPLPLQAALQEGVVHGDVVLGQGQREVKAALGASGGVFLHHVGLDLGEGGARSLSQQQLPTGGGGERERRQIRLIVFVIYLFIY